MNRLILFLFLTANFTIVLGQNKTDNALSCAEEAKLLNTPSAISMMGQNRVLKTSIVALARVENVDVSGHSNRLHLSILELYQGNLDEKSITVNYVSGYPLDTPSQLYQNDSIIIQFWLKTVDAISLKSISEYSWHTILSNSTDFVQNNGLPEHTDFNPLFKETNSSVIRLTESNKHLLLDEYRYYKQESERLRSECSWREKVNGYYKLYCLYSKRENFDLAFASLSLYNSTLLSSQLNNYKEQKDKMQQAIDLDAQSWEGLGYSSIFVIQYLQDFTKIDYNDTLTAMIINMAKSKGEKYANEQIRKLKERKKDYQKQLKQLNKYLE